MLHFMDRATIYYLKQKGWSNVQIAEFTGHHRDTIAKVLKEPVDQRPKQRERTSSIDVFQAQISAWLKEPLPVIRMLELARSDLDHPYQGSETAFYDYVRKRRRARKPAPREVALRFEGMPGEFLQVDWGEVRDLPLTHAGATRTRYFFAARLKYSRFMFVQFHSDMREETFLRALIDCFLTIGGVPWVVVTDNMKTAVLGRDAANQPIWNPAYQKLAAEFKFLPEACAPAAGNQKGSVENLVKFVKGNFLPGRSFHDDRDLAEQVREWLTQVNTERMNDATKAFPATLLAEEARHFGPLPAPAEDYGFFDCVVVNRESLVALESNHYSVPTHLVGRALTARVHRMHIDLFADGELVASHPRCQDQHQRVLDPAHFEEAFKSKPRGRIMLYRDWLCGLSPEATRYLRELCHKRRAEMTQQITLLYATAQQTPRADFVTALELAAEQQMYGAEYVQAILARPKRAAPSVWAGGTERGHWVGVPGPEEVERSLSQYEQYIANRDSLLQEQGARR
jgi:transposase